MKKIALALCLTLSASMALCQDSMEKIMESRAREMYRVISLDAPESWKKFIKENYTKALIDKPMRSQVEGGDSGSSTATSQTHEGNIEGKAAMYRMLHNDLGGGKISTLKITGEKVDMVVNSSGTVGTISLKFSKEKPYLIDGLGVELGN